MILLLIPFLHYSFYSTNCFFNKDINDNVTGSWLQIAWKCDYSYRLLNINLNKIKPNDSGPLKTAKQDIITGICLLDSKVENFNFFLLTLQFGLQISIPRSPPDCMWDGEELSVIRNVCNYKSRVGSSFP